MTSKSEAERLTRQYERAEAERKRLSAYYDQRRREGKPPISWWEWVIMFPFAVGIVILLAGFMSMIYRGI